MSKIAFMFPGQGSFEAGMGRDVAEAVPAAMAVYVDGHAETWTDPTRNPPPAADAPGMAAARAAENLFDIGTDDTLWDRD